MEALLGLFDLRVIFIEILGYKLSYLELVGTLSGFACVWLTARENIWCWPVGIVNIVFFFAMFFQLRLYSDMFLQVYFLATSVYGWWKWAHPRTPDEANRRNELKISLIGPRKMLWLLAACLVSIIAFGTFINNVHVLLPQFFPERAAFPYADSVVAVLSVAAQFIMARKKLECWLFWISVDALALAIYFLKGVNLVAIEYLVFGCIALYGFLGWRREYRGYSKRYLSQSHRGTENVL